MGPFEVMAGIQILRDHVHHVVFQLGFSDGLSVASLLLWRGGHLGRSGLQVSWVEHLSFPYRPWELRGVQEDAEQSGGCAGTAAGTRAESYRNRLAGAQWSCLHCSTAPDSLSSALTVPSRCSSVVKSSRGAGRATAFLPSRSIIGLVSIVSPVCFFCTLNLLLLFTCGRELIILLWFCGWGRYCSPGGALGLAAVNLRECWAQLSPLPVTVKMSWRDSTGLGPALSLPLPQEQNLPMDLAGGWSFSVRTWRMYHTRAVSIRS